MTDREKAIVMAYTGTTMLTGEKFSIFHKYIEDILGRSVWTHELADRSVWEEIKENSKSDFLELCKNEAPTVEITEKQAILLLINSGWLVNHDKELREKWGRPQGEWIEHNRNYDAHSMRMFISCECSACHMYEDFPQDNETGNVLTSHYCKWCGSNMWKEEQE